MKCPWLVYTLKINREKLVNGSLVKEEETEQSYENCIMTDCPYYIPPTRCKEYPYLYEKNAKCGRAVI